MIVVRRRCSMFCRGSYMGRLLGPRVEGDTGHACRPPHRRARALPEQHESDVRLYKWLLDLGFLHVFNEEIDPKPDFEWWEKGSGVEKEGREVKGRWMVEESQSGPLFGGPHLYYWCCCRYYCYYYYYFLRIWKFHLICSFFLDFYNGCIIKSGYVHSIIKHQIWTFLKNFYKWSLHHFY